VILGEVVTLYLKNPQKPQEKVLAVATVLTPSPTPEITASPSPSPLPTITPTPIPTPSPLPPGEINVLIDRFSSQYSVDPNVMRHIAICESGFNPNAKKLSYVGLFQFGPATWQNIRKEIGEDTNINLRYSVEESVQTAAYSLSKGKRGIWPNCAP
jgi:soluble lytic murein transglycosylase-like protein